MVLFICSSVYSEFPLYNAFSSIRLVSFPSYYTFTIHNSSFPANLNPLLRGLQHLDESRLSAPLLRGVHILPARRSRQAHQNTLNPRTWCIQSKGGTSIMNQVELDVSAPTNLLPLLLLRRKRHILPLINNGQIRRQERLQARLNKRKAILLIILSVVQVIEEDAADATRLVTVLVGEVFVAPVLETWVVGLVMLVASILDSLVEVDGVLVEEVGGREIGAAAEPPCAYAAVWVLGLEVAVIEVDGWCHGVDWVKNHAQASGEEWERVDGGIDLLVVCAHLEDGLLWEAAVDNGDVHTGFLEDVAIL